MSTAAIYTNMKERELESILKVFRARKAFSAQSAIRLNDKIFFEKNFFNKVLQPDDLQSYPFIKLTQNNKYCFNQSEYDLFLSHTNQDNIVILVIIVALLASIIYLL